MIMTTFLQCLYKKESPIDMLRSQIMEFISFDFRVINLSNLLIVAKGRRQNSLPLTTNFSPKLTQPSKGIRYPVGDLCRHFTKLTFPSAYTLHSNPIPPTGGTNGFL